MKKLLAMFALMALCATACFAGYNGQDDGAYRGSKSVHFTVSVASTTTAAIFATTTYSGTFSTMDNMEFEVCGSSPIFISSATATATGTPAAPGSTSRYMAVGTKYSIGGRNTSSIYGKVQDGSSGSAFITGTVWGH
jgi:hypothetical protein